METPRKIALAPATVMELLDRTFKIYRENFVSFVGLVALVTIPITIINLIINFWSLNMMRSAGLSGQGLPSGSASAFDANTLLNLFTQSIGLFLFALLLGFISSFIQGVLVYGPLTTIASESNLGRKATIGEAFRAMQGHFRALAGGLLAYHLIYFMLIVIFGLGAIVTCGLTIGVIVYISMVLYAFLTPVLVLERVGALEGLSRAWALAKARFWSVFGLYALVVIISVLLSVTLSFVNTLMTRGVVGPASYNTSVILQAVTQALTQIFITPIMPIGLTLMYYDARIRLEGLDIALQNIGTPEPRPIDIPSPPPPGETFSRDDFINMAIICVGTLIICAILFFLYYLVIKSFM